MPSQQRHKLDDKAKKCIFVGYSAKSKGYRLYYPLMNTIIVRQDVVFIENLVFLMHECKNQPIVSSQEMFDPLMPLFQNGAHDYGLVDQAIEVERIEKFPQNGAVNAQKFQQNMGGNF